MDFLLPTDDWHHVFCHCDADCFYVSAEVARTPSLRGKPVIVGHDIVIAKSYEAKAFGIKTGTPVWEAKKLCKHLILLPLDFAYYANMSESLMEILANYSDEMEIFSVDECFLNLKGTLRMHHCSSYEELGKKIKDHVYSQLGITVSIGIAPTKLLAKLASDMNKPNGLTIVPQTKIPEFLHNQPIESLCGIGKQRSVILKRQGISYIDDFIAQGRNTAYKLLGKSGIEYFYEMKGLSIFPIDTMNHTPKSISKTASFEKPHSNKAIIKTALFNHLERGIKKLLEHGLIVKTIGVYYRYKDFTHEVHTANLEEHTDSIQTIYASCFRLFESSFYPHRIYRSCGIYFTDLILKTQKQDSLFAGEKRNDNSLAHIKVALQNQYGKQALMFGTELFSPMQSPIKEVEGGWF